MKRTIEIECPDGYKPIYDTKTGKVEIVPETIIDRIKTYSDAQNYLGDDNVYYNRSVNSLAMLQTILDALNEGYKFNLLTGTVWYPLIRFFRMKSMPKDAKVIGYFNYRGEKFVLVGGYSNDVGNSGISCFDSYDGIGYTCSTIGMFACKSEEIANYVSTQFGKLIFEACFARHFEDKEFEWLD